MKATSPLSWLYLCLLSITIWNLGCGSAQNPSIPPSPVTGAPHDAATQALYVVTRDAVSGFAIQPADGSLIPLSGSPFALPVNLSSLIANPAAPFILASDADDSSRIWALHVNTQGSLQIGSAPALQSVAPFEPPNKLAFSSSGKIVYLSNYLGPMVVSAHSFDETSGSIATRPTSQTGFPAPCNDPSLCSQDLSILGDSTAPDAQYLWVQYTSCGFHQDCNNSLEPIPVSTDGATLAPNPAGATNSEGSSVSGASMFSGGVVLVQQITCCLFTQLESYIFNGGKLASAIGCSGLNRAGDPTACATAWSVIIHPNQKLVIIGTTDNRLLTAARDSAGNLSMPVDTGITLAMQPDKLLFDQSGQHVYVLGAQNLIYGFSVDANGGTLKLIPGSPWTVPTYSASTGVIIQLPGAD